MFLPWIPALFAALAGGAIDLEMYYLSGGLYFGFAWSIWVLYVAGKEGSSE